MSSKLFRAFFAFLLLVDFCIAADNLQHIRANNNQDAAGLIQNGVLRVNLEITQGRWYPEEENSASIPIEAFAEVGRAPQIPGPAIHVLEGTTISISIHNKTGAAAKVYGFQTHPAGADSGVEIASGETRELSFSAGAAGIYFYWATTSNEKLTDRSGEDSQLSGAIIVEPGTSNMNVDEHTFVFGHWGDDQNEVWVINGKMWPYTERLVGAVGRPMRSRWINASDEDHPMHLHGAYFTVLSEGDALNNKVFDASLRPLAATRTLQSGKTWEIEWTPENPGNWLFHCHIPFHTDYHLGLNSAPNNMKMSQMQHMRGLAIGLSVAGVRIPDPQNANRKLDLYVSERDQHYDAVEDVGDGLTGMGYSVTEGDAPLKPPSNPGPPIFLNQGEPVEIAIHNLLKEPTSVHWHGIELQSYYDGVAGWGGDTHQQTPAILPGRTFVAKFTPPRAGSFMYHSHLNEVDQVSLGLSGPLIVLEPGKSFDPEKDKIFFISRDGPDDVKAPFLLNGSASPAPMVLRPNVTYRLRFLELTTGKDVQLFLMRTGKPVEWKAIAKDGADLPTAQATRRSAVQWIKTGETFDFEWTPVAGQYRLEGRGPKGDIRLAVDITVGP